MSHPFAPLSAWFRALVSSALEPRAPTEIILEALAGATGMTLVADLEDISANETKRLLALGRRTVLAAGPGHQRDEEAEDLRGAIELARAGLAALRGDTGSALRGPQDPVHPPDGRLSAAILGELDGFALASMGLHIVGCDACGDRLAVLHMASAPAVAPLRVAAASAVAMRKPDAGRVILTVEAPEADIVLFDDEGELSLAVYATDSAPTRLVGDGLETVEMLAGYWLGAIAPGTARIRATLWVGDASSAIDLAIPSRVTTS